MAPKALSKKALSTFPYAVNDVVTIKVVGTWRVLSFSSLRRPYLPPCRQPGCLRYTLLSVDNDSCPRTDAYSAHLPRAPPAPAIY